MSVILPPHITKFSYVALLIYISDEDKVCKCVPGKQRRFASYLILIYLI